MASDYSNYTCSVHWMQQMPGHTNFVFYMTNFSSVMEKAMEQCCAPGSSNKNGCLSWCYYNLTDSDKAVHVKYIDDFKVCLNRETTRATGNATFYTVDKGLYSDFNRARNAAPVVGPEFGVKGVLLVALTAVSLVLA